MHRLSFFITFLAHSFSRQVEGTCFIGTRAFVKPVTLSASSRAAGMSTALLDNWSLEQEGGDASNTPELSDGYGGSGLTYPPGGEYKATLIWLHGLGDTARGWGPQLADLLRRNKGTELDHVKLILPTAPTRRVTLNFGMAMPAWWDIKGLNPDQADVPEHLDECLARLTKIIDGEKDKPVVIGGFSQGGALAVHTALNYGSSEAVKACVGLSSWLPVASSYDGNTDKVEAIKRKQLPMLMCHGTADQVVAFDWGVRSRDFLIKTLGVDVQWETLNGVGHGSSEDEMRSVANFLQRVLS
ncbi:unnamed protein product [Vitrella brassicaformis CCMP3155]|uniref:Phospholipase/carboxylesterase/thioesterase domain-containing protein n=2 Tax=Vitrella brassicaformis TaxID=1169539 RepID=A0A0G4EI48_VITBC|nr:unnamed protein product [Vitrella brassicaformis CCMP3155]|mmetsp:Transcript_5972/g.17011  ORF Transcript_5972/g.17011 Transcript_5972/m.17011 type:complete len:299 (-) Transcript_5972:360-1256(-)|eukprot:CEL95651.1 unnamed protein product [Vitrella brassicaformis CCMP3155]